jgi:hypothetical protein
LKPSFDELEAIVRRRVCAACKERTVESICGRQEPGQCSLFALFPLVVEAIVATDSVNAQDYIGAIREHVCSVCIDQRLDGTCPERENQTCALDGYFPQVIEAIQEATGKSLRGPNMVLQ